MPFKPAKALFRTSTSISCPRIFNLPQRNIFLTPRLWIDSTPIHTHIPGASSLFQFLAPSRECEKRVIWINLQVSIIKAPLVCLCACVVVLADHHHHHHHNAANKSFLIRLHIITVSSSSTDVDREKKGLTGGVLSLAL